jgi:hypothetical protein
MYDFVAMVTVKTCENYVFCGIDHGSTFWRSWQHFRCSNFPSRKVKLPPVITACIKLCPPYHGRKLGLKCLGIPLFNFVRYSHASYCNERTCVQLLLSQEWLSRFPKFSLLFRWQNLTWTRTRAYNSQFRIVSIALHTENNFLEGFFKGTQQGPAMQNGRRYRSVCSYHVFRSAASSPAIKKKPPM